MRISRGDVLIQLDPAASMINNLEKLQREREDERDQG
jgi:hypothetical protein